MNLKELVGGLIHRNAGVNAEFTPGYLEFDDLSSHLFLLKHKLEKRGLFPVLSIGSSHAAWAQWWAYEALDCFKCGDAEGALRYANISFEEIARYDALESHGEDYNIGNIGASEGLMYMRGWKK